MRSILLCWLWQLSTILAKRQGRKNQASPSSSAASYNHVWSSVILERHVTDRGRYNIRQMASSPVIPDSLIVSVNVSFGRCWGRLRRIQKWHFSHTCSSMEAMQGRFRWCAVYLWELGLGFVSRPPSWFVRFCSFRFVSTCLALLMLPWTFQFQTLHWEIFGHLSDKSWSWNFRGF